MTKNYSKGAYNLDLINKINQYDLLILEKYYSEILSYFDPDKYVLEFWPGNLKWFQYLYSKWFRKFILVEIDEWFYLSQKEFLSIYKDVEVIHLHKNICDPDIFNNIDISQVWLISSFQVIEHIEKSEFQSFIQKLYNSNYTWFLLFETINAQNIIQWNFAIYHDDTHKLSFTPRSLKMILTEIGDFDFKTTIWVWYPNIISIGSLFKYKIIPDKYLIFTFIFNTFYGFPYFLSKLISRFFLSRYISKNDKTFDAWFSIFFKITTNDNI